MLFDWLVIGHVIEVNPAYAVCGPKIRSEKRQDAVLAVGKDGLCPAPLARPPSSPGK
jgi:hypothetical protein